MFCSQCGKKLPDTAMFCVNCGHKFDKTGGRKCINVKKKKFIKKFVIVGCCTCLPILIYFSLFHKTPDWNYRIDDGKATIMRYNGKESVIIIPETIKIGLISYDVTRIDWIEFNEYSNMTSIEIPGSVT